MNFNINYNDVKKLLGLLYNNPYHLVVPYIEILHNLKESDGNLTLQDHLNSENKLIANNNSKEE